MRGVAPAPYKELSSLTSIYACAVGAQNGVLLVRVRTMRGVAPAPHKELSSLTSIYACAVGEQNEFCF
ncbi:MAG: hypothetical protein J6A46_00250 [Clostridia bacterium]|nr:hypothetical protein [Clostridia bacterium]